jgi:hypothetical protein
MMDGSDRSRDFYHENSRPPSVTPVYRDFRFSKMENLTTRVLHFADGLDLFRSFAPSLGGLTFGHLPTDPTADGFSGQDLTAQMVPNQFGISRIAISTFLCISKRNFNSYAHFSRSDGHEGSPSLPNRS